MPYTSSFGVTGLANTSALRASSDSVSVVCMEESPTSRDRQGSGVGDVVLEAAVVEDEAWHDSSSRMHSRSASVASVASH